MHAILNLINNNNKYKMCVKLDCIKDVLYQINGKFQIAKKINTF